MLQEIKNSILKKVKRLKLFYFNTDLKYFRQCCEHLSKTQEKPFFVKVGANDGLTGDPISDMLLNNPKWRGLLIEPVPYAFKQLEENFKNSSRFILEQVAIGSSNSKTPFYFVDPIAKKEIPNLPTWYDQLGSFDKAHILKHLDGNLGPYIRCLDIDVFTLTQILEKHEIKKVHLLHIDTEGYDYEILKTLDLTYNPPMIIFIEHQHLPTKQKEEMRDHLKKNKYIVIDCGTDYFAQRKSDSKH